MMIEEAGWPPDWTCDVMHTLIYFKHCVILLAENSPTFRTICIAAFVNPQSHCLSSETLFVAERQALDKSSGAHECEGTFPLFRSRAPRSELSGGTWGAGFSCIPADWKHAYPFEPRTEPFDEASKGAQRYHLGDGGTRR